MKWKKVDKDFVSKVGDFIFRLHYCSMGVYSMGRGYSLQVRKKDETSFRPLGYVFWVSRDGGYNTWAEMSVDGKLWETQEMLKRAEELLKGLEYI